MLRGSVGIFKKFRVKEPANDPAKKEPREIFRNRQESRRGPYRNDRRQSYQVGRIEASEPPTEVVERGVLLCRTPGS